MTKPRLRNKHQKRTRLTNTATTSPSPTFAAPTTTPPTNGPTTTNSPTTVTPPCPTHESRKLCLVRIAYFLCLCCYWLRFYWVSLPASLSSIDPSTSSSLAFWGSFQPQMIYPRLDHIAPMSDAEAAKYSPLMRVMFQRPLVVDLTPTVNHIINRLPTGTIVYRRGLSEVQIPYTNISLLPWLLPIVINDTDKSMSGHPERDLRARALDLLFGHHAGVILNPSDYGGVIKLGTLRLNRTIVLHFIDHGEIPSHDAFQVNYDFVTNFYRINEPFWYQLPRTKSNTWLKHSQQDIRHWKQRNTQQIKRIVAVHQTNIPDILKELEESAALIRNISLEHERKLKDMAQNHEMTDGTRSLVDQSISSVKSQEQHLRDRIAKVIEDPIEDFPTIDHIRDIVHQKILDRANEMFNTTGYRERKQCQHLASYVAIGVPSSPTILALAHILQLYCSFNNQIFAIVAGLWWVDFLYYCCCRRSAASLKCVPWDVRSLVYWVTFFVVILWLLLNPILHFIVHHMYFGAYVHPVETHGNQLYGLALGIVSIIICLLMLALRFATCTPWSKRALILGPSASHIWFFSTISLVLLSCWFVQHTPTYFFQLIQQEASLVERQKTLQSLQDLGINITDFVYPD